MPPFQQDDGWRRLFRAVFKRSSNPMTLLDDRRRHVDVNGAYTKLLGYKRSELIGRPITEIVAAEQQLTLREWRSVVARGDHTGEREVVRADGTSVKVQLAGHPELVSGNRYVLYVVLHTSRSRARESRPPGSGSLTRREVEVVHLVALGRTAREIAEELHISYDTVRTHIRNAMGKAGARSQAQLVAKALAEGLIAPP